MELRDRNKETKDLRGGCGGRTMDRSAGAAKRGAILVPYKYNNNNNVITVGLVPGRVESGILIFVSQGTHRQLFCCLQDKRFIGGHRRGRGCNIYDFAAERKLNKSRPAEMTGCAAIKCLYLVRNPSSILTSDLLVFSLP